MSATPPSCPQHLICLHHPLQLQPPTGKHLFVGKTHTHQQHLTNTHCSNTSTKSRSAVLPLPTRCPIGINEQKKTTTQENNHTSVVALQEPSISSFHSFFLTLFESRHCLPRKCIMAPGHAKVLIKHRKLSKDKLLHTGRFRRSSRGFAALLEGDLIEADEGGEEHSTFTSPHPPFPSANGEINQYRQ